MQKNAIFQKMSYCTFNLNTGRLVMSFKFLAWAWLVVASGFHTTVQDIK